MDNNTETITRDMLIEKIDNEYIGLQKGLNDEGDDLFAYRKDCMGHIRNALYNTPIPDELIAVAYERYNVLREAYLFWTAKASCGDVIVDKEELALNCSRLWLDSVRNEYRHSLLCERMTAEHAEFIAEVRRKTPDEIIDDAWKITCYNDLLMLLANEELDTRDIDALLTLRYPLYSVYDEYLSRDMSDQMNNLLDTAKDIAQLQKENLADGYLPKHAVDKKFINEYLEYYGNSPPDEEAETVVPGLEP